MTKKIGHRGVQKPFLDRDGIKRKCYTFQLLNEAFDTYKAHCLKRDINYRDTLDTFIVSQNILFDQQDKEARETMLCEEQLTIQALKSPELKDIIGEYVADFIKEARKTHV